MFRCQLNPIEPPRHVAHMPGGVGGAAPRGAPLSRSIILLLPYRLRFLSTFVRRRQRAVGCEQAGDGGTVYQSRQRRIDYSAARFGEATTRGEPAAFRHACCGRHVAQQHVAVPRLVGMETGTADSKARV
jgi:hypothetical protein